MANVTLTNITPPRVPLTDERTGLISREWYRFFLNLFNLTGGGQNTTSLTDLQVGPPQFQVDEITNLINKVSDNLTPSDNTSEITAALNTLRQFVETLPDNCCELVQQLNTLRQELQTLPIELISEIAELRKQIEGLQLLPPPRQFAASRYGSFYDTTTQTATTINTATAITFNNTDLSNGVFLDSPTSRVTVDTPGIYNFQTSIQLDSTVSSAQEFYLWFRLNGVDVTNSASQLRIQGNNAEIFVALNYFFNLKANDYVELMYSVSDLGVRLLASGAVAPHPGIPSIILTVSNNIGGFQ